MTLAEKYHNGKWTDIVSGDITTYNPVMDTYKLRDGSYIIRQAIEIEGRWEVRVMNGSSRIREHKIKLDSDLLDRRRMR